MAKIVRFTAVGAALAVALLVGAARFEPMSQDVFRAADAGFAPGATPR